MRYIIDSRYFDGTCLTSMSDDMHSDYGGETLEALREREEPVPGRCITGTHDTACEALYPGTLQALP